MPFRRRYKIKDQTDSKELEKEKYFRERKKLEIPRDVPGMGIPIPNIPGNCGNGNENLSLGIIPTIPGNMGMGMNLRGKSQIPMGFPKKEFLSVKSLKSFESKRKILKT